MRTYQTALEEANMNDLSTDLAPPPKLPMVVHGEMDTMKQQALTLIKGGLLPDALKGKPDAVLTVMLWGRELGISPVRAVNTIHVIEGRPSISANLMLTLVRERIPGVQLLVVEATAERNTIKHRRSQADDWQLSTYTIEEAKAAGLVKPTSTGKPSTWMKFPADMLFNRNSARVCRWSYSDALCGVIYTPEELEDIKPMSAERSDLVASRVVSPAAPTTPKADPVQPVDGDKVNEDAMLDLVAAMMDAQEEQELSGIHDRFAEFHKGSPATVAAAFDAYHKQLQRLGRKGVE